MAVIFMAAFPAYALAQPRDTLGVIDTLYFGEGEGVAGGHVAVPVVVANDYPYLGMSIPIAYPNGILTADSVSFLGGRVAHFAQLTENIDNARGVLLIGAVQFIGEPMAAGRGPIAWLHFTIAGGATLGTIATVDTGYFSDPGVLLFVADVGGGTEVVPYVSPGHATVVPPNEPPAFLPVSAQTVREGDSLSILILTSDPDGDSVHVSLLNRPAGSRLAGSGTGQVDFKWAAPYTGPYSALSSPLLLRFSADDGRDVSIMDVPVTVVNVNRPPAITVPDTLWLPAFDSLNWAVQATDPDLDPVTLSVSNLPSSANLAAGNPATIRWKPIQTDTGSYPIVFQAADPYGGVTEATSLLRVTAVARVEFSLDTVSGYSDQEVVMNIRMKNREIVSGFELLVNIDPTATTITRIDREGARTENWEMFVVTQNYNGNPGDLRILARADINDGTVTPKLEAGDGNIVNIRLHLINDEDYAGLSFPVRFVFRSEFANTASDAANELIAQDEIEYSHGAVQILLYEDKLAGDLNLNGLAFEIADVVVLANYFTNPSLYPLSFEQRANSDANLDGVPATISDLVYMINRLTGGSALRIADLTRQTASWTLDADGRFFVAADVPLGGAYVIFESTSDIAPYAGPAGTGMTLVAGHTGTTTYALLYSMEGNRIDPAAGALLEGLKTSAILDVQLSDASGFPVDVASSLVLPEQPTLLGNYPNPFNPSTSIRFMLDRPQDVRILVFNVLGQRVRTLQEYFDAGEHEMEWNGDNDRGVSVSSGVYLYRIESGESSEIRRMLLLK
jgi:hypothetical protein